MASNWYTRGLRRLQGGATGAINWVSASNIKVLLLTGGTPYTPNKDHEFVSDVVVSEADGTGYIGGFGGAGRKALGSKAITDDTATDRVNYGAANPSWTGLNLSNGSITHAIVFAEGTADTDSPLIACLDPADLVTNGGDVGLTFPSGIVAHIQC